MYFARVHSSENERSVKNFIRDSSYNSQVLYQGRAKFGPCIKRTADAVSYTHLTLPKSSGHSGGARGRQAEFRTRVHGNGNLLIGHAYTRRLGLEPGQEFKIELQRDSGMIVLQQMDQDQP